MLPRLVILGRLPAILSKGDYHVRQHPPHRCPPRHLRPPGRLRDRPRGGGRLQLLHPGTGNDPFPGAGEGHDPDPPPLGGGWPGAALGRRARKRTVPLLHLLREGGVRGLLRGGRGAGGGPLRGRPTLRGRRPPVHVSTRRALLVVWRLGRPHRGLTTPNWRPGL